MKQLLLAIALVAGALPAEAQIGSVVRAQKINEVSGGLVGPVPVLGYSLAAIGDLNGDGVGDLVAGVPTDNAGGHERGGLLVLFLNANGTVASQQRINQNVGGLTVTLPDEAYFGDAISALGDLDGDGRLELAVHTRLPRSTWILFLRPDGTVRALREIPWSDPVYGGTTEGRDFFTAYLPGLAGLGDLDGDGVGDLAVGAPFDDDGDRDAGAIWILYLNRDGSAKAAKKISQSSGGFTGDLHEESLFGHSLARLGDLDGDGIPELAAGEFGGGDIHRWILYLDRHQDVARATTLAQLDESLAPVGDLDGDGLTELAAEGLRLRFITPDARQRKLLTIRPGLNGMPRDPAVNALGNYALAGLGDLDGDGTLELAAGDIGDSQTGGALWILSLARTPIWNGSGVNPLVYKEYSEPVVGSTWEAVLDCTGHRPGVAAVFGFSRGLSGVLVRSGELLVDPASRPLFLLTVPHRGGPVLFSAAVPPDPALVDLQIFSQGACTGAPGTRLSNALYLLVGN